MQWYNKLMPKVSEVKTFLDKYSKELKNKVNSIEDIFVIGNASKKFNKDSAIIKNLDLLIKSNIYSEDLISINEQDQEEESPFKMNEENLEIMGFNPEAIKFTKKLTEPTAYNIEKWCISSDNKVLHWGAIIDDPDEWQQIKQEAEGAAKEATRKSKNQLEKCSQEIVDQWSTIYEHHINRYLKEMPKGWYQINYKPKDLLEDSIKIN